MKKLIGIIFFLHAGILLAQQAPIYSQFMLNDYLINPAAVGTKGYYDAMMSNRNQWVGINDAPRTLVLSTQGPLKNRKMGLGGYFVNDVAGHVKQQGFYLSYSYIAQLSGGVKLSFGLSSGLQSYGVDGTKLRLNEGGDQILSSGLQTSWVPDGSFGLMFYTDRLRTGFSINQIYGSKLTFFSDGNEGTARLHRHFNIHGSYLIGNSDAAFNFTPYFLVKYQSPLPAQFDLGLQLIYMDNVWLGTAYRSGESYAVFAGCLIRENIVFGYSYDIITSDIGLRARQSHEILLGLRLQRSLPPKKQ